MTRAERFLALHQPADPLLIPNPWDAGSAKLLAALGYRALATTSSGHAGTLGRQDGGVSREEALAHAREMVRATELPVSADLENGFADEPTAVADTVHAAATAGLAGCSIEDHPAGGDVAIYELGLATERVAAAAEIARNAASRIILTARAENHLHGQLDLADTIARLQAYQEAGADVLYAPGLTSEAEIEELIRSVDVPVNVLLRPNGPSVERLASLGVARISLGGALYRASLGALARSARSLLEEGIADFWDDAQAGGAHIRESF